MQDCFKKSFLYFCPIVFGKKLLPLSLGHIVFLDLISSPFFSSGKKFLSDYVQLAYFCSMPFSDCMKKLNDFKETLKEIETWKQSLELSDKEKLLEELETLNEYWTYYNDFPKRFETDKTSKDSLKVPVHFYIYYILKDKFEEQEIFDMPLTKAISLITVHQNINGDNSLMSESDEMLIEKIKSNETAEPVLNDLNKEI